MISDKSKKIYELSYHDQLNNFNFWLDNLPKFYDCQIRQISLDWICHNYPKSFSSLEEFIFLRELIFSYDTSNLLIVMGVIKSKLVEMINNGS